MRNFLTEDLLFSQKGLCSKELVSWLFSRCRLAASRLKVNTGYHIMLLKHTLSIHKICPLLKPCPTPMTCVLPLQFHL